MEIEINNADLSEFTEFSLSVLDKHGSKKQSFISANNANSITKNLRKAFMERLKLRNKYFRETKDEVKLFYILNKEIFARVFYVKKVFYLNIYSNLGGNISSLKIAFSVSYKIKKYESQLSIFKIKEIMVEKNISLSFKFIDSKKLFDVLRKLQNKKAYQENNTPVKITKENTNIVRDFLYNFSNNLLFSSHSSSDLEKIDKIAN